MKAHAHTVHSGLSLASAPSVRRRRQALRAMPPPPPLARRRCERAQAPTCVVDQRKNLSRLTNAMDRMD